MVDDLGLEALARMQALDAESEVTKFRERWTAGKTLPREQQAVDWMRDQLGAPREAVRFALYFGDSLDVSRERWRHAGHRWGGHDADGEPVGEYETAALPAMRRLGVLCCKLARSFGREWIDQGPAFVLSDVIPRLRPAQYLGKSSLQTGGPRNVSGPLSQTIILFVRPQATLADVAAEYQRAHERIREGLADRTPRERIKPMTSPRMRDLAVLGARVALHEFPTWAHALAVYKSETGDPTPYDNENRGRFRRDVRAAYKRVTGLDLDFRPDKRGTPPEARLDWLDQDEPTLRVKTARRNGEATGHGTVEG